MQVLTQTHRSDSICDGFKCEFPNCTKSFTTKNGRKSHFDREHRGKKFKCNICSKRLASKHSVHRHILSAHSNEESEEEKEEENVTNIVYDRVEEIVPEQREDEVIQQQREKIQLLENDWKNAQQEIKILRQQYKSMHSR